MTAECSDPRYDPETWFRAEDAPLAVAVCAVCPVQSACLDIAMRTEGRRSGELRHGVFGGLTPGERAALYQKRRKAKR